MNLIVRHKGLAKEWAVDYIFDKVGKLLVETYPEITFQRELISEFPHWEGVPRQGSLIIENPSNNKTIVLTYDDAPKNILIQKPDTGWIVANMQQMFCTSNFKEIQDFKDFYLEYSNIDVQKVVQPFSYSVYRSTFDTKYCDIVYAQKKSSEFRKQGLFFRGLFYGEREYCYFNNTHSEIRVTNKDYKNLPEYAYELADYRCGLSFTGAAEICFRDMELMGLGIPIIRPLLTSVEFKEPLIPDVHYISFEGDTAESKQQALIDKWEEVKHKYDFLDYIGDNARKWYLKNIRLDTQAKLFIDSINLNLIIF